MRLHTWSAWLLLILIGFLGVLPDEADQPVLTTGRLLSAADGCTDGGDPQQAPEVETIAPSSVAVPARKIADGRIALSVYRCALLSSNTRASMTPSSSVLGTTSPKQTPLRR
jgi:hypothetical protein